MLGIAFIVESAAAATAVGGNLMAGHDLETDNWYRKVTWIGVTGSDAVGECIIEVKYGDHKVGETQNYHTTGVLTWDQVQPIASRLTCRPGEAIKLVLRGAASATNALEIVMGIKEIRRARR